MHERYWQLKHSPFGQDVAADSFYQGLTYKNALAKLKYVVERHHGAGLLVGANGVGKTRLLQELIASPAVASSPVAFVVYPQMSARELIRYVTLRLPSASGQDVSSTGSSSETSVIGMDAVLNGLESKLRHFAANGRPALVIVDDAHVINDREVLQSLQLLLNIQATPGAEFSLVLSGQPELAGTIHRVHALADRIAMPCILQPLTLEETTAYIDHRFQAARLVRDDSARMPFTEDACRAVHELSSGLPRRINRLCEFALLIGFAEKRPLLGAEQIEAVHAELSLSRAA